MENKTRPTTTPVPDFLDGLDARRRGEAEDLVDEYLASVPHAARPHLDELRALVREVAPEAQEVLSYDIIGYRPAGTKRAHGFISGWRDHIGVYPVPKDSALQAELKPYRRGKGTLWFPLDEPLPRELLARVFAALLTTGG